MFRENSLQWYKVIVENEDVLFREFVIENLIQMVDLDVSLIEIYDTLSIPSQIFIYTNSIDYLKTVREKYFFEVCEKPIEEIHTRFSNGKMGQLSI